MISIVQRRVGILPKSKSNVELSPYPGGKWIRPGCNGGRHYLLNLKGKWGHMKRIEKGREKIYDNKNKLFGTAPPTIFGQHPLSTTAVEGETVFFMCQFRGAEYPVSQIRWRKNKQLMVTLPYSGYRHHRPMTLTGGDDFPQRARVFPENGTLKIDSVSLGDSSNYSCEVITPGHPPVESRPSQLFVTGNGRKYCDNFFNNIFFLVFNRNPKIRAKIDRQEVRTGI
jgi:hypothetical protein